MRCWELKMSESLYIFYFLNDKINNYQREIYFEKRSKCVLLKASHNIEFNKRVIPEGKTVVMYNNSKVYFRNYMIQTFLLSASEKKRLRKIEELRDKRKYNNYPTILLDIKKIKKRKTKRTKM